MQSLKTQKQYKQAFRAGLPDRMKREAILQLFSLNPVTCETRYKNIVQMTGEDFLEHAKAARRAASALEYHFLNQQGLDELEIILALIFKEKLIKHSPLMI